jgi:hypothetical protein
VAGRIPGLSISPTHSVLSDVYNVPVHFTVDPTPFKNLSVYDCWITAELDYNDFAKLYLSVKVVSGTITQHLIREYSNLVWICLLMIVFLDWCTYNGPEYCNKGMCNNNTQLCDCEANFYGSTCDTYCLANTTCSGHGSCGIGGNCLCDINWHGEVCY